MTNLKATIAIFIWSGAVGYGLWWLRVQDHIPSGSTDSMWGIEPTWVSVLVVSRNRPRIDYCFNG